MSDSDPIIKQKISDLVFERLKSMIYSGELAPGDVMPSERALMSRFAVGRPAIREALQSLANKGLVSISHGERTRVNVLDASLVLKQVDEVARLLIATQPANLNHLQQIRHMLELGTVRLAVDTVNDEDIADLRRLIEQQTEETEDPAAFTEIDIQFHVRIARSTDNPILPEITQTLLCWLFEYYRPLLHWSGRERSTLVEHADVVEKLKLRDREGLEKVMSYHLKQSGLHYFSNEESSTKAPSP